MSPPQFSEDFIQELNKLFSWRRDVRHFQTTPVEDTLLDQLLSIACMAPSVGLSEPWHYIKVETQKLRQEIYTLFKTCNEQAAQQYASEQQQLYSNLKLSGLNEAPHHIAVFSEENPAQGKGLGRHTMPETTAYSTVMSIFSFWLAARAHNIGVGWVSILPPQKVKTILSVPDHWTFIAYLCVGYPQFQYETPELEQRGWEKRNPDRKQWIIR
ncbi:5,6-dimethylbenzimidazole synthase [Commensalibacter papalotli (ex Botero et al. 2024)]|uniref:Nitroreductase (NfnB) (PDB:1F5V) n=1 Tax=Commensalibacter papalotli (ex Botero et al. 2024) TaxID=2972766 RepID=A0ABN8W3G5_9PROT|nr:5,6-dimethylbenzimidazole synthase [Commensalibacter papalotli (ex Botero et al. 2024)]CAI3930147.1 Nitroreductase (NfnB) (PDB:1F5V) [Commensalibacter papalotli (ex Botero et al. 2024)]CAI3948481.1 Nitroreductase (NfnB) (PDB:1F5V) [Commensalibacter papalotli (ex Botero et al. 2024)]